MFSHLVIIDRVASDIRCNRPLLSQSIDSLLSSVDFPYALISTNLRRMSRPECFPVT